MYLARSPSEKFVNIQSTSSRFSIQSQKVQYDVVALVVNVLAVVVRRRLVDNVYLRGSSVAGRTQPEIVRAAINGELGEVSVCCTRARLEQIIVR